MRWFLAILLSASLVIAQDHATPSETIGGFTIRRSVTQISKRVLFLFDCSGSMDPTDLARAIDATLLVAEQPTDEMEIAVIAFSGSTLRWPGVSDPPGTPNPVPPGWASLPSQKAIDEVRSWLSSFRGAGNTHILPALAAAMQEQRDELTIILVTDGMFNDSLMVPVSLTKAILGTISYHQSKRKTAGLDPARFLFFGINDGTMMLSEVAESLGCGYLVEERIEEPVPDWSLPIGPPAPPPPPFPPK